MFCVYCVFCVFDGSVLNLIKLCSGKGDDVEKDKRRFTLKEKERLKGDVTGTRF